MSNTETLLSHWRSVEKLVRMWARQYISNGTRLYDFDDLMQQGYLAMLDALRTFDPDKGAFPTRLRYYVRKRFAEASGRYGSKQRPEVNAVSLHVPLDTESDIMDTIADDSADFEANLVERESIRQDCASILAEFDKLPHMERQAARLTLWECKTLTEAGAILNLSPERVRLLKDRAVKRVRRTKTARLISADYYRPVSASRFRQTHTSSVEELVLWMDALGN